MRGVTRFRKQPYLFLPGTAGNYASTPDSAAVSQTGDQDVRIKLSQDSWVAGTFLWNHMPTGTDRGIRIGVTNAGRMRFEWSVDGTNVIIKDSSAAIPAANGAVIRLRWVLDVDNGAAGNDVKFYTSDDGVMWTQLGTTQTTAGVTSVHDSSGSPVLGNMTAGKIYYAEVRNGIDGPVVAKFDPRVSTQQWPTSWADPETGETWTINQSGAEGFYPPIRARVEK